MSEALEQNRSVDVPAAATWSRNTRYLWDARRVLRNAGVAGLLLSTAIAFTLPKRYTSSATILPPDQPSSSAAMLAELAGRSSPGGVGALAGSLLGARTNGELYVDLLRSGSVQGALADRFHLQTIYRKRYMQDTIKKLNARTQIAENKKSGVITIAVEDGDRQRAQQLAQGYLDELNELLVRVSTSSARKERQFVEGRLIAVSAQLDQAEEQLSQFSSSTATVDLKEQTQAMVDAGERLQVQLIAGQSELESLKQIYGDENVRVRAAKERIGVLQHQLEKIGGSATPLAMQGASSADGGSPSIVYPALRRLPELGVRWADLYRRVRVEEAVYDLLSADYETARIQEAKEVASINVIDAPGLPEKKSFPHRLLLMLAGTAVALLGMSLGLLLKRSWDQMEDDNDIKTIGTQMLASLRLRRAVTRVEKVQP